MHPFAKYIQILGKGHKGTRSLTYDEAYEAMRMIACYDVEPEQLGAFLMLLRVKEESAEEVAGFTRALKESLPIHGKQITPSIDWAAYAGKKRQLPWFLLAALIVVQRGYSVCMHGMSRSDDRVYVPEALDALGMEAANSLQEGIDGFVQDGFCYLPISKLSPLTAQLIAMRDLLGLRLPLQTVARMLNPFNAPLSLIGVFHPNYASIHTQAAVQINKHKLLVCKGEGGEFERIPERPVQLNGSDNESVWEEEWKPLLKPGSTVKEQRLNLNHYRAVWEGEAKDAYGEAAVIGTLAMVIKALDLEACELSAHRLATLWWHERRRFDNAGEAVIS
ncbi:MAG: glycosyl transferase family protein [Candidatus Thiodiazotropha sp.]|jgi:anthranilate phosphoribosyltransferase